MTDEYQQATKKLLDYVTQAIEFSKEQMPDVVAQLLTYDAKIAGVLLLVCIICCIASIFGFVLSLLTDSEGWQVVTLFLALLFGVCSFGNYATLVKIETAPKLYVLDELARRANSGSK